MNTVVLPENAILVSTTRHERPLLYTSPHFPTVRVHSHVSFFRRKFWASKVTYRGSAADFLVVLWKPGNPTTSATEGDYTHLDNFLRLSSMSKVVLFEGCSSSFGGSSAQNRGLGGDVRLKSGAPAAVPTAVCRSTENGDLAWTAKAVLKIYCHKRDINSSRRKVCSVYHVLHKCTRGDRAVYLHRAGPGATGDRRCLKGYDPGPNGIVRNNEERSWAPRRFPWYRATWATNPPVIGSRMYLAELPWRRGCSVIRCAPRGIFNFLSVFSNKAPFGLPPID